MAIFSQKTYFESVTEIQMMATAHVITQAKTLKQKSSEGPMEGQMEK